MLVRDRDRLRQVGQGGLQLDGVLRAGELAAGGRGHPPQRVGVGDQRVASAAPAEGAAAERTAPERTAAAEPPAARPVADLRGVADHRRRRRGAEADRVDAQPAGGGLLGRGLRLDALGVRAVGEHDDDVRRVRASSRVAGDARAGPRDRRVDVRDRVDRGEDRLPDRGSPGGGSDSTGSRSVSIRCSGTPDRRIRPDSSASRVSTPARNRLRGERRDVVLGIGGRHGRGRLRAVGEDQADRAAIGDDVVRGEHGAVRRHDHTGAERAAGGTDDGHRGTHPLVDVGDADGRRRRRGRGRARGRWAPSRPAPEASTATATTRTTSTTPPAASTPREPRSRDTARGPDAIPLRLRTSPVGLR